MNKKKVIIIILVVLLLLQQGAHMAKDNYQLGNDLYDAAQQMASQCFMLTDSITFLEERFERGDTDDLDHARHAFDEAVASCWSGFGYDDMPIRNEVRSDYTGRIMDIYDQIVNDTENKRLIGLFTEEQKTNELAVLKAQLELMTDTLTDFCNRYNETPNWKRYFVSWKNERERLTEKLRIPGSDDS